MSLFKKTLIMPLFLISVANAWQDTLVVTCSKANSVGQTDNQHVNEMNNGKIDTTKDISVDIKATLVSTGAKQDQKSEAKLTGTVENFSVKKSNDLLLEIKKGEQVNGVSSSRTDDNKRYISISDEKFIIYGYYDTTSTSEQNVNMVVPDARLVPQGAPEGLMKIPAVIPLTCNVSVTSKVE